MAKDSDFSVNGPDTLGKAVLYILVGVAIAIVTIETIYTLIALLSCDQVCIDFQWLL